MQEKTHMPPTAPVEQDPAARPTPTVFARRTFAAACTGLALCVAIGIISASLH
jgi:hypothetical protein